MPEHRSTHQVMNWVRGLTSTVQRRCGLLHAFPSTQRRVKWQLLCQLLWEKVVPSKAGRDLYHGPAFPQAIDILHQCARMMREGCRYRYRVRHVSTLVSPRAT